MKKILIGLIITFVSSGALFFRSQPDGLLHIYILDVGQGDSILIQTPSGKHILVDGGAEKKVLQQLQETLPFFNSKIDYVVPTHPDRDHIEGLIYVVQRYDVGQVLHTGVYSKNNLSQRLLERAHRKNIPIRIADASSDIVFEDGVIFDVLYPFTQNIGESEDTNNTSLVAKVIFGTQSVLLTGDSEIPEEHKLLDAHINLKADVLKVSHHGSKTGTSEDFLRAVSPKYGAISAGAHNTYHHPHPSVMKRLSEFKTQILRTDEDGRIEFIFSKNGIVNIKTAAGKIQRVIQSTRTISAPSARNFSSNRS